MSSCPREHQGKSMERLIFEGDHVDTVMGPALVFKHFTCIDCGATGWEFEAPDYGTVRLDDRLSAWQEIASGGNV